MKFDLDALDTFFREDYSPSELARLLDEFLYDYLLMLVRLQLLDKDDKTIHEHTDKFIFYFRLLKDVLEHCPEK